MHNKCNVLQSLRNHPNTLVHEKLSSTKPIPSDKKIGDCYYKGLKDAGVVYVTISSLTFSISYRGSEQGLEIASIIFITYHKITRLYKCADSIYQLQS